MNTTLTESNPSRSSGAIKEGYKQTPVGVIPEDWEVKKFKECFNQLRTYTYSRKQLTYKQNEDDIYNIHYGDIHAAFPKNILDTERNLDLIPIIIDANIEEPTLLKDGDLIMADASEDYEGVGQSVELIKIGNKKIVAGTHTFALRPKISFAPKYTGFIFSAFQAHKALKKIATGISVFGLSKFNIAKVKLPIPPLPEQKAIADCLSTWDKGIEKLTAIIQSKKEQKKGLMQQLLTGTVRVTSPSGEKFTEEWKEVRFNDLFQRVNSKKHQINSKEYIEEGKYPVVDQGKTKIVGYSNQEKRIYTDLPVIVFGDHTREIKFIDFDFIIGADGTQLLKNKNNDSIDFLYYILKNTPIVNLGYSRHMRVLITKKFIIPALKEQLAIVEILITSDKEIELLEQKLAFFKTQKKGLMQVLLTGEKRLVS